MENTLIKPKKTVSEVIFLNSLDIVSAKDPFFCEKPYKGVKMGTGSCKLCDCPGFKPSSGGRTCINQNSAGGTCNHYESEHY